MFWETVSAIFLLIASVYIWLPLSLVLAFIVFALSFVYRFIMVMSVDSTDFVGDVVEAVFMSIVNGLSALIALPTWMWDWAKYSHPWWALFISIGLCILFVRLSD